MNENVMGWDKMDFLYVVGFCFQRWRFVGVGSSFFHSLMKEEWDGLG